MKKILLTLSVLVALSACGGQSEEQPASAQPQEQAQSELKTIPVSYTDYQSAANKGLADQKPGCPCLNMYPQPIMQKERICCMTFQTASH